MSGSKTAQKIVLTKDQTTFLGSYLRKGLTGVFYGKQNKQTKQDFRTLLAAEGRYAAASQDLPADALAPLATDLAAAQTAKTQGRFTDAAGAYDRLTTRATTARTDLVARRDLLRTRLAQATTPDWAAAAAAQAMATKRGVAQGRLMNDLPSLAAMTQAATALDELDALREPERLRVVAERGHHFTLIIVII